MKWIFSCKFLGGSFSTIQSVKREMPIPLAIPLAMAGVSALSSIWGGSKSASANKKAQQQLKDEAARVEAERTRRLNEDYLDTAAGQNLLRIARDERDKMWKRAQGAAAVGGGTDAAVALAKEQGNKMVGDTIANIAAGDSQRRDAADAGYRAELSRLNQQQIANEQARSQAIAQAASGAGSALMQGAVSTFGGTKLGQDWMGLGSPGGGGVVGTSGTPSQLERMGSSLLRYNKDYGLLSQSALYNPYTFWNL